MELIFLDTETTGNDVAKDRLCQVCYRTSSGTWTEYFKPPLPISVKAMSITHVTNRMVEGKPPFQGSRMMKDLESLFESGGVLVAHNAKFDKAMLENEGMKIPRHICTLRVARFLDQKGIIPEYNLQYLRYYLDLDIKGAAHDAEGDVNVLHEVFQRLLAKIMAADAGSASDASGRTDDEKKEAAVQRMIEISSTPSLYRTFSFGKHKDKQIEDVVRVDRGYLEWLLKQKREAEDDDEDMIYTLEHYLGLKK